MAAIQQPAPQAGKKPRARKHSFHLDMTPMVDLAFLLLTFFMLTTTFAKPRVMQLTMPVPSKDKTKVASHDALTLVLGKNHQVHYYFGLNAPADPTVAVPPLHTTNFKAQGIRQVLLAFRRQDPKGVILIKPSSAAVYRDMVDILDEMSITDQSRYALYRPQRRRPPTAGSQRERVAASAASGVISHGLAFTNSSAMHSSPISRPAISSKMKWRLGLLLVVAAVMLLPTLFLVISNLVKPPVLQLALPAKGRAAPAGAPAEALTILVGSGRQPYYYFGTATPTVADSLHAATPARPIGQVIRAWQQRHKATVFIKNSTEGNYKMLTDLLDELNSTNQRRYAVVAATAADRQLVASAQQ